MSDRKLIGIVRLASTSFFFSPRMNSQRKQGSKSGIKTDKYGNPLNYGNYKNGRLVVKKKPKNATPKKREEQSPGVNRSNGRKTPTPSTKTNTKQVQKNKGKKVEQPKSETLASVGLTGAAHTVIRDALVSSTAFPSPPAQPPVGHATLEPNDTEQTSTKRSSRQSKSRSSFPDLVPPPMIKGDDDTMGPMGEQRRGLPVYNFKDKLLQTIASHRVTVVEGETG